MSAVQPLSAKLSRLKPGAPLASGKSVLVVEDSRAVRELLCGYLRQIGGFGIEVAGTLAETRRLLEQSPERFFCAAMAL